VSALWTAEELAAATGAPAPGFAASGVSIDTRTLVPGDLFVALMGENGDGHAYVAAALAKGAAGALVHRSVAGVDAAKLLVVNDTLAGLTALGRHARARFAGRVVAVTGSVGKTTTKEMLRAMLGTFGPTHAATASYNNHWGVPLTLARAPREADFAIIEIGTNHPGEILPLTRLARPHVALVTTVERAHVGHFGSIEAIADEKAAILEGLEPGGTAVLPADHPLFARMLAHAGEARVRRFGRGAEADARLLSLAADAEGSDVRASIGARETTFRLGAPGAHMAMNALAALAVVDSLGLNVGRAAGTLASFAAVGGRGTRRRIAVADGEALLLDESYNASAASVRAALQVLALQPAKRRVVVLGDMLELGDDGPAEHNGLAEPVASTADLLFTCGVLMRGLYDSVPARIRGVHAGDSAALLPAVIGALRPGDAVLVKGSLGSRMSRIVQALVAPPATVAEAR
jgi:UDP-N-acetylmuramoyl-tripeptide--D-alanyl-D-alanine ligase